MAKELTLGDIKKVIQEAFADLKISNDKRFDLIDMRFDKFDKRFAGVDERFSSMDRRFDRMDQRFDGVDESINDLREALNLHSSETDRQFREIRSGMATKDYVDDRIGELRGEFRQALKRSQSGRAAA